MSACGAAAVAFAALLGWALDVDLLRSTFPGGATMKANTAVCVSLIAAALLCHGKSVAAKRILALSSVILAAATWAQTLFHVDFGIDNLLFFDLDSAADPGRMSIASSLAFITIGAAVSGVFTRSQRQAELLGGPMAMAALLSTVVQGSHAESLYVFEVFSSFSLNTSVAVCLLYVSLLCVAPRRGLLRVSISNTLGGAMTRRLLPFAVLGPIVFEWIRRAGEAAGYYDRFVGSAALVLLMVTSLVWLIYSSADNIHRVEMERRATRRALQEAEERYRGIFNNSPRGLFQISTDGELLAANPTMGRLLEGPGGSTSIVGQNLFDRIGGEQGGELQRLLEREHRVSAFQVSLRRGDASRPGEETWVQIEARPTLGPNGEVVRYEGAAEDITEEKKMAAQLFQAQKMESVGQLAGGVAHDFNNLLTAVIGYADILMMKLPLQDPKRRDVGEIQEAAERAAQLTRQLLTFSRRDVHQPVVMPINDIITGVERMLRRAVTENIQVTFRLDPDVGLVRVDRNQIEQVLLNLVLNARDAMPEGGRISVETKLVTVEEHEMRPPFAHGERLARLTVTDTGIGMGKATQEKIFDPFFTTKKEGTGLGLSTVYGIVEQNGGRIWVYSEEGVGSAFRIHFPVVDEAPTPAAPRAVEPATFSGHETVLVAEDEKAVLRLVDLALSDSGYTTILATGGEEALAKMEGHEGEIDLLLTDVVMPDMRGPELARRLRARKPDLKVIYMSGYSAGALDDQQGLESEPVHFIQKPFSGRNIAKMVRDVLDEAEP